jgi:hypothetical protein
MIVRRRSDHCGHNDLQWLDFVQRLINLVGGVLNALGSLRVLGVALYQCELLKNYGTRINLSNKNSL